MADPTRLRSLPSGREQQLRRLFAEEALERLARLKRQLPELEEAGRDEEVGPSIYRDVHSIKGGAARAGAYGVRRIARAMEDLVEQILNHDRPVSGELVEALLAATDDIVSMIPAVVEGEEQPGVGDAPAERLHALLFVER
jgi:chemotaxis protein histidine kinase CheA